MREVSERARGELINVRGKIPKIPTLGETGIWDPGGETTLLSSLLPVVANERWILSSLPLALGVQVVDSVTSFYSIIQ